MMTNNYRSFLWFIVPLVVMVFLFEMALLGKIPLASDTVSIQPIKEWKQNYFSSNEDSPHWYPYSFSGMPSYGSYIYTPGDPTSAILKTVLFNRGLKYWFHFTLGGLGIYLFLRRKKIGFVSAIFGGVAFALSPYLFGLINAGHATKIIAISYIPWIFLAVDYCIYKRKLRGILFLSLISALQLWSNHPQIVYYTWMLIVFLWLWNQSTSLLKKEWKLQTDGKATGLILGGLFVSILMVSDPYVSVYEFQRQSNRGALSVLDQSGETATGTKWKYATQWSFHPYELVSFLYPYFYGMQNYPTRDAKSAAYWGYMPFTQSTHYVGLLVILFAILGALIKKPDQFNAFLWVVTALILLVGFGHYFPVLFGPLFKLAPFFSKFRVPSMIYVLLMFTLGILAAYGLENIFIILKRGDEQERYKLKKRLLIIFGSVIFLTIVLGIFGESVISFVKSGEGGRYTIQSLKQIKAIRLDLFQKGLLMALAIIVVSFLSIWFAIRNKIKPEITGGIIILLTIFDFWYVDKDFLHLKDPTKMEEQFLPTAEIDFLLKDESQFRIIPLDDLNTNRYGYFGLASVGGYRPVKLRIYQDLMDAGGLNNLSILNMLNVKYLIAKKSINHPNLKPVFTERQNVYQNLSVLPRAWMVANLIQANSQRESLIETLGKEFEPVRQAVVVNYDGPQITADINGEVTVLDYHENVITLKSVSDTTGLLVLSEIYYKPGWRASIDGNTVKIYQTNHVLRSILVPSGEHEIRFWYHDRTWKISKMISRSVFLCGLIVLGWIYRSRCITFFTKFK